MSIRYLVIDSHKNMSQKRRNSLKSFFREVKGITSEEDAEKQVEFCDWYESEYAVKWFEMVMMSGGEVVGYLRCFRNPDDIRQWYIGDVHVRNAFREQGIATVMYERALRELIRFEAAENVISAVRRDNEKSIGLHIKMGFFDTGKPCEFASFFVDENENKYMKWLYRYLPVPTDAPAAKVTEIMLPLWKEYLKKSGKYDNDKKSAASLKKILQKNESGEISFTGIWCGNRLVGFAYGDVSYLPEQKG